MKNKIKITELDPINGIHVFEASGPVFETDNMGPLAQKNHIVLLTQYEDNGEVDWQGIHFYSTGKDWYSLVSAQDDTVEKIRDTKLTGILCTPEFFDFLEDNDDKITEEGITIEPSTEEKGALVVHSFLDEGMFSENTRHHVAPKVEDVLLAMNLLIMDMHLATYKDMAKNLFSDSHEYREFRKALKENIELLREWHRRQAAILRKKCKPKSKTHV